MCIRDRTCDIRINEPFICRISVHALRRRCSDDDDKSFPQSQSALLVDVNESIFAGQTRSQFSIIINHRHLRSERIERDPSRIESTFQKTIQSFDRNQRSDRQSVRKTRDTTGRRQSRNSQIGTREPSISDRLIDLDRESL